MFTKFFRYSIFLYNWLSGESKLSTINWKLT